MKDTVIPCKHETGEISDRKMMVSDYHPLGRNAVINLLSKASLLCKRKNSGIALAEIQVRLNQAIPGMVCPRPISGEIARKMNFLDQLFVDSCHLGGTRRVVRQIMSVLR